MDPNDWLRRWSTADREAERGFPALPRWNTFLLQLLISMAATRPLPHSFLLCAPRIYLVPCGRSRIFGANDEPTDRE